MTRRAAIQMDPLDAINPGGDSTLLLGLEAQKRGYDLYHYTPDKLTWKQGAITAMAHKVTLYDDHANHYKLGDLVKLDLETMDVILLRQDPPFDMNYITTTYLLEMLPPSVHVFNNPTAVRNYAEKISPLLFARFMPPTLVSADMREIEYFRNHHKDIIIKPLYGFGGRSILRIKHDDDNFHAVMEMHFSTSKEPLMVQAFLPEVATGDRRVVMIDGHVGGAIGRIPAENEIRANLRVGGTAAKAELTPKQQEICEAVGSLLKEHGLIFAGLDLIGDWLTEINVTSPTGLASINKLYGRRIESDIWDAMERYL
jgi:glutathione synthase